MKFRTKKRIWNTIIFTLVSILFLNILLTCLDVINSASAIAIPWFSFLIVGIFDPDKRPPVENPKRDTRLGMIL